MTHRTDIAITGIGAVFPGAPDLDAFWATVLAGKSTAREVSGSRWTLPVDDAFAPGGPTSDRVYSTRACLIETEPEIDLSDLDIPAEVLEELDPSVRLLLAAGVRAFNDAGSLTDRDRIGVIVGNLALPTQASSELTREWLGQTFEERVLGHTSARRPRGLHPLNRYVTGLPAGVLAKALRLGGGSVTLDAACASSLYAIKLAVDELRSGRLDAILAGGLSRPDPLYTQMGFSQLRALSPTGICSPFDAKGNGLVVGEGAGIFVLKRLSDAIAAGDPIYGVIKGIGLSNDIGGSLLAPSSEGQLRAMRAAYRESGWAPHDVDHIECHATGTPLGDAVEVESLRALWGAEDWRPGQCIIGSAKSNFGHTLTAAGSVALIKTLLAMREGVLPPTANYERPAPNVALDGSPFEVLSKSRTWNRRTKATPRRAAVSAFGFGGINAHVLVEEWLDESPAPVIEVNTPETSAAIAIVGMEAHFGPWNSLRAFQERVLGAGEAHEAEAPAQWWGIEHSAWLRAQGLSEDSFKGYFVPEVAVPLDRFRIPPRELEEMLPQQLLMLQVAAAALDDAGIARVNQDQGGSPNAGTFIGLGLDLNTTNFSFRWSLAQAARKWADKLGLHLGEDELASWTQSLRNAAGPALTANRTMGALASIVASRIAREFKFGGPSFTLSSEESSGMRALEAAVRALQSRTLDYALVGAIDMAGDARAALATHQTRPFSSSATARPFDENADGTVIGEGAAAVVLKRLEDAERDGNRVYCVIRGIGTASGGGVDRVPDEHAYVRALERAYADAHLTPDAVTYIETHGTGCPDEDHMEIRALARVFKRPDGALASDHVSNLCFIGSAKADVGHAGAASGFAGLVKSALCLYHEILPPVRNFERGRADLTSAGHRLRVAQRPQYWFRDRAKGPRIAGVSSFSIDGNCSHVVLEGYDHGIDHAVHVERLQPLGARNEGLFAVEANNAEALSIGISRLQAHVEHHPQHGIEKLARDWWHENRGDASKPLGVTFVARSHDELLRQIEFMQRWLAERPNDRLSGKETGIVPPHVRDRVFYNPDPLAPSGEVAFVYPGSGNQYAHMGRDLMLQWPEIPRRQDAENEFLFSQYQPDIFWNSDSTAQINDNHKAALFGQVALGTASTDLMRSFGLRPAAVIGYSLGETAGLVSTKAWRDRDLMLQRINESTLFTQDLAGEYRAARKAWQLPSNKTVDWALGVIDRPAKVVRAALQDHKKVYTLIVNTLHECVVGGDLHAVEKLVKKLDCEFFPLHGVTTVHCEVAKEVQEPYRELHLLPTNAPKGVRFYSGAWGTAYNVSRESAADSVLAQAIYGIDYPKVIESAYEDGARIFIEMGPGASCSRMIGEILGERPHVARSICFQGQDATTSTLRALAQLIAERVPVDLSVLYGQETAVVAHRDPAPEVPCVRVATGGKPFEVVLPEHKPAPIKRAPAHVEVPKIAPPKPTLLPQPVPAAAPAFAAIASADPLVAQWAAMTQTRADAHDAYLRASSATVAAMATAIQMQLDILSGVAIAEGPNRIEQRVEIPAPPVPPRTITREPRRPLAMTREQCLEYARGSIAKSMGHEWAEIDTHPTRVRLPDEPLMLVDRILSFEGEPRSLTSGRVITEHDVLPGAWYLDCNRIPTCIAVEAGQADLILAAYLGIDFKTHGRAMYRLLDAVVTFHRHLPQPGETIHYDIRIERFFRQGDTHLMRFNFDATVNGEPVITMREGCAGYFTREELDAGAGIVKTKLDLQPIPGKRPSDWIELVPMQRESYPDDQLNALRAGDLAGCFGERFAALNLKNPVGLPGGQMKLVDRILDLDPQGGRFGIGKIRGEMDVHPDDWFLTCHFVDDMVMPGTLMYECCLHTLRVHLLRMGWIGEANQVVYEPVQGVPGRLKCRGEVNETTDRVIYEIEIKELGYNPAPYAIADCLMYVDGKPAIEMLDMSIQLTGLTRESLESMWRDAAVTPAGPRTAIYDNASIMAYAEGNPSEAFGEPYKVFDRERFIARLPRPPYKFLDRIVATEAEPWLMRAGGTIEAEYDVPPDEWYFASNRQPTMPFSILLEIALQPCGWFSAYMGSPLTSDKDLHYRNLGGTAIQHLPVTPDIGTLATRVRCTGVSSSGGMIIQNFHFDTTNRGRLVYSGDTNFGYFSKVALANQIGIRDARVHIPTDQELSVSAEFPYPRIAPYPDDTMRMIDRVDVFDPKGGAHGLGFIRAYIDVDPSLWFFRAHFYQDPVWPGSLGLEAMLQLMKYVAAERWSVGGTPQFETVALGEPHKWIYRGQVIPGDERVTIQASITAIDDARQLIRANGFLTVDGRVIYEMQDFTIRYSERA